MIYAVFQGRHDLAISIKCDYKLYSIVELSGNDEQIKQQMIKYAVDQMVLNGSSNPETPLISTKVLTLQDGNIWGQGTVIEHDFNGVWYMFVHKSDVINLFMRE